MKNSTKKILLFMLASYSLMLTGVILGKNFNLTVILILTLSVLIGILLIYDIKDIDKSKSFFTRVKLFLSYKTHLLSVITLVLLMLFSLKYLTFISFIALAISGCMGVIYSLSVKMFKIKKILILKNIFIGVGWGLLIIAGAGHISDSIIIYMTILAIIQVFIGSTIRDLKDKDYDTENNVKTLAVVFGIDKTVVVLHFVNLMSFTLLYFFSSHNFLSIVSVIFFWRFINLLYLRKKVDSKFWSQTFNLLTCIVFFIISILSIYGIN